MLEKKTQSGTTVVLDATHFIDIFEDREAHTVEAYLYSPDGEPRLLWAEKYEAFYDYLHPIIRFGQAAIHDYDRFLAQQHT